MVLSRLSGECSLSDLNLSLSRTGIVALGDNEGDEGGLDSCLPTDAFEFEELVQVCRKWCFQGYRVSVPYLTSI